MKTGLLVFFAAVLISAGTSGFCLQPDGNPQKRQRAKTAGEQQGQRPAGQKRMSGMISLEIAREHAIADRILLICEAFAGKLERKQPLVPGTLVQAVELIRAFVQDRQEAQEEKYIYPPFQRANLNTDLIRVLSEQHQAGRKLMEGITAKLREQPSAAGDAFIAESLRAFVRMYRPHLARENTVLLPEFRDLVSSKDYTGMENSFKSEDSRRQKEKGVENVMSLVGMLEGSLGISDIAHYGPSPLLR